MPNLIAIRSVAICVALSASAIADDHSDIRLAVVYDSAMSHSDFERIASSSTGTKPSDIIDKSLTYAILTLNVEDDEAANSDFRLLDTNEPKPAALASEIYRERITGSRRILTGPVTVIHADRITSFTCDVKDDTATGVVGFKAPTLYEGSVKYVANKVKSTWVVSEFQMSSRKIHLVRNHEGLWIPKPH